MKRVLVLMLSILFLIIGIHQSFYHGIANSYWIFMFSVCFLFLLKFVKPEEEKEEEPEKKKKERSTKYKSKKRKRIG
ncbi:MAG: Ca2+/Na+ antiporter [Flammeovirgaceae bacterium]|jgi:Ca2+/Na+ antiporter